MTRYPPVGPFDLAQVRLMALGVHPRTWWEQWPRPERRVSSARWGYPAPSEITLGDIDRVAAWFDARAGRS